MTGDPTDGLEELRSVCPRAQELKEAGVRYIYLPDLRVPGLGKVDGLLRPQTRDGDGYATRLFLPAVVPGKGQNWTQHRILDRTWHTWSWKDVAPDSRLVQILANHLRALR